MGKYGDESTGTKEKWGFMQKYYHKGVFYMDDDSLKADGDVRKNNFNEPTLEDKFDKENFKLYAGLTENIKNSINYLSNLVITIIINTKIN